MPLAKIYVLEGQRDEVRISGRPEALINVLKVSPDGFLPNHPVGTERTLNSSRHHADRGRR